MVSRGQGGKAEITEADLKDFEETKQDKRFEKFKKTIELYEEQILRYERHGKPVWISDYQVFDSSKVPNCVCSGRRTFEFQIMPQMLNYLGNYDLDWGVITVYTCENDCDIDGKYVHEYPIKQDIMHSDELVGIDIDKIDLGGNYRLETDLTTRDNKNVGKKSSQQIKNSIGEPVSSLDKVFEDKEEWE